MAIAYCSNSPCESWAEFVVTQPDNGNIFFLCLTCKEAFEWGQASPEADISPIEDKEDDSPIDEVAQDVQQ